MNNMKQINRGMKQYKDIEKFNTYELTECVAFEMAIRVDAVVKMIKERQKIVNEYKHNKNGFQLLEQMRHLNEKLKPYGLTQYNICNKENPNKGEIRTFQIINKDEKVLTELSTTSIVDSTEISTLDSSTKIIFSRPELSLENSRITYIPLLLSLTKNELIAQISHIKDQFNKNHLIVKTPLELLGEELNIKKEDYKYFNASEWADNFFIYDFWKVSPDASKDKYRDLIDKLTEYHGYKVQKSLKEQKKGEPIYKPVSYKAFNKLKSEGTYKDKKVKAYYSESSIKNRVKLMKAFIDDLKYKTLING